MYVFKVFVEYSVSVIELHHLRWLVRNTFIILLEVLLRWTFICNTNNIISIVSQLLAIQRKFVSVLILYLIHVFYFCVQIDSITLVQGFIDLGVNLVAVVYFEIHAILGKVMHFIEVSLLITYGFD